MQSNLDWKQSGQNHAAKLIDLNRNGMVQCLVLILWDLSLQEEGGGGCIQHLVWQWVFIVLLADQHQMRSCLAGASTCFWTLGTEHLQQVTQNAQFQLVCGTSDFYVLLVQGEHLPVKTSIVCQSSGGSATPRITLTLNTRGFPWQTDTCNSISLASPSLFCATFHSDINYLVNNDHSGLPKKKNEHRADIVQIIGNGSNKTIIWEKGKHATLKDKLLQVNDKL